MTLNHLRVSRRFHSSAPSDSDALSALVPAAFAPRSFTSLRRCRDGHGSIFLHQTQPNPSHVLENATQPMSISVANASRDSLYCWLGSFGKLFHMHSLLCSFIFWARLFCAASADAPGGAAAPSAPPPVRYATVSVRCTALPRRLGRSRSAKCGTAKLKDVSVSSDSTRFGRRSRVVALNKTLQRCSQQLLYNTIKVTHTRLPSVGFRS